MQNEYRESRFIRAAEATASDRARFIRKTYWHLAFAILAFVGLEAVLLHSPVAEPLTQLMLGGQYSWLIVLGLFIGVTWIGNRWAQSPANVPLQYAGLALYVVAYAVITMPLLLIAQAHEPGVILKAAIMTVALFLGLTSTAFITRKDFSFLGPIVSIGLWVAFALIICAILFGFSLGLFFSAAVVVLIAGCILYTTSNMLRVYGTDQYVAASLLLFGSIITMFWYILQIFMGSRR